MRLVIGKKKARTNNTLTARGITHNRVVFRVNRVARQLQFALVPFNQLFKLPNSTRQNSSFPPANNKSNRFKRLDRVQLLVALAVADEDFGLAVEDAVFHVWWGEEGVDVDQDGSEGDDGPLGEEVLFLIERLIERSEIKGKGISADQLFSISSQSRP